MDINELVIPDAVVEKVESGVWIDDITDFPGLRLRVRGINSKIYQTEFARRLRMVPRKERDRDGNPNVEALREAQALAAHKYLLLEWDGLNDGDSPVPYSADLAKKLITNPNARLLDAVIWAARVADNEAAAINEDIEKN